MREDGDRYIWLMVLMAVVGLGLPGLARSGAPASGASSAGVDKAGQREPARAAAPQDAAQAAQATDMAREFFAPLVDMLGCEQAPPPIGRANPDFQTWFEQCRLGSLALHREAIVALVPDPLDSMFEHLFDRVLEAINRAAGQAGYVRDRYYLPWQKPLAARGRDTGTGPPAQDHRSTPGLLLFRSSCPPAAAPSPETPGCEPGVLAILLVGESSIWGLHHKALERALQVADTITTDGSDRRLRILGPTFSGSIASLRAELEHYLDGHDMQHGGFDVVSGSATDPDNAAWMTAPPPAPGAPPAPGSRADPVIAYRATVVDDTVTMQRFYRWLAETMRIEPGPAAGMLAGVGILTETDTVYARDFARTGDTTGQSRPGSANPEPVDRSTPLRPEWVVRYPSRLAHLRSIYEHTRKQRLPPAPVAIEDPHAMLDLSLADSDEPVETVPAFSDKTQFSDELVLTGALKAICHSDLRFLGIVGSDVIDRLILAREAHRYCPNVRLFMVETDVLLAHPDVQDEMNGTLLVSPYPLFPQNGAWTPWATRGLIAPFGDGNTQGIYNAMMILLGRGGDQIVEIMPWHRQELPIGNALPVWVAAAGNGTLWPVAVLEGDAPDRSPDTPATARASRAQEPRASGSPTRAFAAPGSWTWALFAIWLACTAVAASYWLGHYPPRLRSLGRHAPRRGFLVIRKLRVFRSVDGAAVEHAVFALLALVPMTCAYVASAAFVLIEPILLRPRGERLFEGSLLNALWVAFRSSPLAVVTVATGILLAAACAHAVIHPVMMAVEGKLRSDRQRVRWLHGAAVICILVLAVALLALVPGVVFRRETWITLRERAINASSGLSPLLPAWVFAAAVLFAARRQLARMHDRAALSMADPMAECGHPAVEGMNRLRDRMLGTIRDFGGKRRLGVVLAVVVAVMWWVGDIPRAMTTLEGRVWSGPLTLAVLAAVALTITSYVPFALGCHRLRRYLRRHANLPTADAFARLPARAAQKMSAILVKPPPAEEMQRALQQLRLLSSHYPATRLQISDDLRAELGAAIDQAPAIQKALQHELATASDADEPDRAPSGAHQQLHRVAQTLARVLAAQWDRGAPSDERTATSPELCKLASEQVRDLPTAELYQRAACDETQVWLRLAEDFVAAQSAGFFHEVLHRLRRLLTAATVTALLVLAGLSSYPFERRPMLLFLIQALIVAMVVGTIILLAGMEHSEVLARIRKTELGKAAWNRSFIARIAIYVLLPMLSVVATQLPAVGNVLFGWLPGLFGLLQ